MDRTVIKQCKCFNEGQDKLYGKGMRLMNLNMKRNAVRCSVCGVEHKVDIPAERKETKGKKK